MKPPPSARLIRGHRLAQGLGGLWTMAENGGLQVFDLSGNGNDGTLNGTAYFGPGKFGHALILDGDSDYAQISDSPSLDVTTQISISIWVKFGTNKLQEIVCKRDGVDRAYYLLMNPGEEIEFTISTDGVNATDRAKSSTSTFSTTKWYHLVGTYDSISGINLYIDEVLQETDYFVGGAINNAASDLYIGRLGGGAEYFDGQCDNVAIYNRALSASEIAELYWKPSCMFERKARTALMNGYAVPPVGAAGIMTTNPGFWGPTF